MGVSLQSQETSRSAPLEKEQRDTLINRNSRFNLWLRRIVFLLFVFVCASMGVLLLILPWRPEWTDNHLLLGSPKLRSFVASGFVRGLCSGLGLLDIWIGFREAIRYHEAK
jgi:hypothetical protein